ncbi:ribonuclease J [Candidatus Gracilibacteria bacterium]|nr:ribonuclease J [Candidatus Gracilibacteria bacterium]MCF7856302.1 ribonuclease J [Candidatus Gracilibacteria bacterium]MCF7896657.1 ribonuclease J [Candidatus Gracilibacteria bacterium]
MNDKLDSWLNKNIGDTEKLKQTPLASHKKFPPQKKFHKKNKARFNKPHPINQQKNSSSPQAESFDDKVRVVPLGGQEEVGRNMSAIFYKEDIVIIDCGLQFPEMDMFGVDYVIPDVKFLEDKIHRIRGILLTHGHLDHIGALQHILPKLNFPPLIGTPLTLGLVKKRLDEYDLTSKVKFIEIKNPAIEKIQLGKHFSAEFFRVNHSIPDGVGICLNTPVGNIVHTGDFKFDFTPADGLKCDFGKIAEIGRRGVLLAFADSTNAEKPGYTISEKIVNENIAQTILEAKGRVILATFSSLIGRIQHIVNAANRSGRKVFVSGRSMIANLEMAEKLGYLKAPQGLIRPLKKGVKINELAPNKVMILCTGSQGEELSALTRIALGEHQTIQVKDGDTVIFSSTPIIGNERAVVAVTNNLLRLGAKVITNKNLDVHTSGHASAEDLKLMHSMLKPKFLVPVHGELHMRHAHRDIAIKVGMDEGNVLLLDNGDILELAPNNIVRKSKSKVRVNNILIDGLGVGDIGTSVLRERQIMSENGIVAIVFKAYKQSSKLVGAPDIISRGFVYMKESNAIVEETKKVAMKAYEEVAKKDYKEVRKEVARAVAKFIRQRIDREPLILPYTIEI